MIIARILTAFYILYFLRKTESLKNIKNMEKICIYLFLLLLIISDTQVKIFGYSFNFLLVGIIVVLFEVLLKNISFKTKYIFLKVYLAILFLLLLYRGGLWILH